MAAADPADTVRAYFAAVRAGDVAALRRVLADDVELVSETVGHMVGGDRVAAFYGEFLGRMGGAEPRPGPLLVDGDRVAVEVEARHAREVHHLAVFYTIRDGRIARIVMYRRPAVAAGPA